MLPTTEQLFSCFVVTTWATKLYLPVYIVRIDERTEEIFILAGEETEVLISRSGSWRLIG